MKSLFLIFAMLGVFFFSCKEIIPEIASPDELSSMNYLEQIYTQPIKQGNTVISLVNDESSTYLTAYDADGASIWKTAVDDYIIPGQNFDDIASVQLKNNADGNIFLNMMQFDHNGEVLKSVRFSSQGVFLNEYTDVVHQTDTIFYQADTIAFPQGSNFIGSGLVPLLDGNTAIVSSCNSVVDTTFVQLSVYDKTGAHAGDQYFILPDSVYILHVYSSKSNRLILESVNYQDEIKFYIINLENQQVNVSPVLPIWGLNSFFENSKGEFVFTSGTFNKDIDYFGLVICLSSTGNVLWYQTYADNTAWIFMSTTETADGYLFTGFSVNVRLLEDIDWRSTFNTEQVKAVVVKTDARGKYKNKIGWSKTIQIMGSSVGAQLLNNEQLTFFGGKYDQTIHSTMVLKLGNEGNIIN